MMESPEIRRLFNWPLQMLLSVILIAMLWFLISTIQMDEELVEQGDGFLQVGQPELALKSYQTALEYDSGNTEAQFQAAVVLSQFGSTNEALAIFDGIDAQALARPARLDLQRGWIFYNRGDVNSAEHHFTEALELIQREPAAYFSDDLGSTYAGLGWATYLQEGCVVALGLFQQAVEASPDLPFAQRGLDTCHE